MTIKGRGGPVKTHSGWPGGTGPGMVGEPMDIAVKAGEKVIGRIRDGGFRPDRIAAYVGPGAGPRWLVSAGFDLALLREGTLGRKRPVILSGASAGALRFAAWVQPEAEKCYRALMDGYIGLTFDDRDNRKSVGRKILELIDGFVENDAIPFALAHRRYRLNVVLAPFLFRTGRFLHRAHPPEIRFPKGLPGADGPAERRQLQARPSRLVGHPPRRLRRPEPLRRPAGGLPGRGARGLSPEHPFR